MSVQKATTWEGPGGQRTRIPHGNMRAKLPNYIGQVFECKADGLHYSCAGPRDNQHVSLLCMVRLVFWLNQINQMNETPYTNQTNLTRASKTFQRPTGIPFITSTTSYFRHRPHEACKLLDSLT